MAKKTTKKKLKSKPKTKVKTKVKAKVKVQAAKKTKAKATKKAKPKKKAQPKAAAALTTYVPMVAVGETVPGFKLQATGLKEVSLDSLKNKKIVLYFYPKDSTPGCTIEGHDFSKLYEDFKQNNTEVYGISRDSMKSHENFKSKQNYCIDLLSDESEELCKIFGVIKLKNMYGKQVRGIERSTFVIDEAGNLVKEWRGVTVEGHAQEVLNFIKGN